ncbi:hypothetical protein GAYE_SCF00G1682 [Galdieria yellowstonensis]|uniref:Protein RER1 n=1 Tax=Galdieria yellowstonensis TaxID=3028027 RepID=A0AAV9I919_9RHOD|nr:hypothetical protein GAYE_SCF00G1682 [Galdieria yellowstonensis]
MDKLVTLRGKYQAVLDKLTPFILYRWLCFGIIISLFLARIFLAQGFYIIAYVLFIYLLNLFILFLQPQDRDALASANTEGPTLPVSSSDEFRPFVRRLPEFKFWLSATRATVLALFATAFRFLDIPVFWPILVIYFILLFVATMRRQIADMIQYRYLPFNIGKKKYSSSSKFVARRQEAHDNDAVALKSSANVKLPTSVQPPRNSATPLDGSQESPSSATKSSSMTMPSPSSRQLHRFHRG